MLLSTIIVRAAAALLAAQVVKALLNPLRGRLKNSKASKQPLVNGVEVEQVATQKTTAKPLNTESLAAEKVNAEKTEADKLALKEPVAEQAEVERLAAEKCALEKSTVEQVEVEKIAAEQATLVQVEADLSVSDETERLRTSVAYFDGLTNYIELPITINDISEQVTIEFWAKGDDSLPQATSVFSAQDHQKNRVFNIHLPWSDGSLYWDSGNVGSKFDRIKKQAEAGEYKSAWTHWAFMKNTATSSMRIYKNGNLWHQGRQKRRPLNADNICTVTIGAFGDASGDHKWCGALTELRVWNRVLKPKEIQVGMGVRACALSDDGLVAYWPLNEALPETLGATVNCVDYVRDTSISFD